jgi:hypothetical protein
MPDSHHHALRPTRTAPRLEGISPRHRKTKPRGLGTELMSPPSARIEQIFEAHIQTLALTLRPGSVCVYRQAPVASSVTSGPAFRACVVSANSAAIPICSDGSDPCGSDPCANHHRLWPQLPIGFCCSLCVACWKIWPLMRKVASARRTFRRYPASCPGRISRPTVNGCSSNCAIPMITCLGPAAHATSPKSPPVPSVKQSERT